MFGDFKDAEKKVANTNNEEEKIESWGFDSNKITIKMILIIYKISINQIN